MFISVLRVAAFLEVMKGTKSRDSLASNRARAHVGPLAGLQNWKVCASNRRGTRFHRIIRRRDLVHFSTLT